MMPRVASNIVSPGTKYPLFLELTFSATGNSQGDQPSWGDLLWSYPGRGQFLNDNDRTIWGGGTIGPNGTGMLNYS